MHKFEIIRDGEKAARGLPCYTFTVDGVPCLRWYREATAEEQVRGLPATYFVERTIARLKAGRSAEAFGPSPAVASGGRELRLADATDEALTRLEEFLAKTGLPAGKVQTILKAARQGRGQGRGRVVREEPTGEAQRVALGSGKVKVREPKAGYRAEVDGRCLGRVFASEAEARAACAVRAFMTAGKLGRIAEAQAALEASHPGKNCTVRVCPKRHAIVAEVDGRPVSVGFSADGVTFKPLAGD